MIVIKRIGKKTIAEYVENSVTVDITVDNEEDSVRVGDMYIAKVKNVVKNINSLFIEYANSKEAYLRMEDKEEFFNNIIYTKERKSGSKYPVAGDEILVRIKTAAKKHKPPTADTKVELSGKYVILSNDGEGVSISKKIRDKEKRKLLEERLNGCLSDCKSQWDSERIANLNNADTALYHFFFHIKLLARTISENHIDETEKEARRLIEKYTDILKKAQTRTVFSCIYKAPENFIELINKLKVSDIGKIRTDDKDVYERLLEYFKDSPDKLDIELWDESKGPMEMITATKKHVEEALKERVWLKSGGYLIIQHTDALTSIDVNTGKDIRSKKGKEALVLKTNLEAALEVARQLRLRNISGIIIVDFIDMKDKENKKEVLKSLEDAVSQDPIRCSVIDMTKLGLVELTRQRKASPLYEKITLEELKV